MRVLQALAHCRFHQALVRRNETACDVSHQSCELTVAWGATSVLCQLGGAAPAEVGQERSFVRADWPPDSCRSECPSVSVANPPKHPRRCRTSGGTGNGARTGGKQSDSTRTVFISDAPLDGAIGLNIGTSHSILLITDSGERPCY